jgi:hypothetical protein
LNDQKKVTKEKSPAVEKLPKISIASLQEKNSSGSCRTQTVFLASLAQEISLRQFFKGGNISASIILLYSIGILAGSKSEKYQEYCSVHPGIGEEVNGKVSELK